MLHLVLFEAGHPADVLTMVRVRGGSKTGQPPGGRLSRRRIRQVRDDVDNRAGNSIVVRGDGSGFSALDATTPAVPTQQAFRVCIFFVPLQVLMPRI